jgi:hypothetical protein
MAERIIDNVMSPEGGVEKRTGGPPGMVGAVSVARGATKGGPVQSTEAGNTPSASTLMPPVSFAGRLDTLENKTVYLVDIGFGGGYKFMQQLQKWFTQNMPSVTTVLKRKPGNVFMDDRNDLWEEIKAKGQAVVLGVAG